MYHNLSLLLLLLWKLSFRLDLFNRYCVTIVAAAIILVEWPLKAKLLLRKTCPKYLVYQQQGHYGIQLSSLASFYRATVINVS